VPRTEPVPGYADDLRVALTEAGYRYDEVAALLGPTAHAALSRNETTPGERATRGGSPLETLVRLWLLQLPVSASAADVALPGLVDRLCAASVLERSVGEVAARVDVRPYGTDGVPDGGNLWVASDLTPGLDGSPGRVDADHVLGISSAATSLAEITVRDTVDRALDLGTGCGVQSLHLAGHAAHVVATDVNPRALWLTRLNAALNGVALDVREGSFFEPVHGERFDLVVTNPPFVISPATGERLVYRDSGLPGDRVVEHIVRTAPAHLTEGGTCQVLANWMILRDQSWQERLTGWVDDCDAWVVQRETCDLPTYVELWLKDAGVHPSTGSGDPAEYRRRYDTWLAWFEEQGAEAVGFGWVNLERTDAEPVLRLEEWPYDVQMPLGDEVAGHFRRTTWLRAAADGTLLDTRLVAPVDLVQEALGAPGAEDPNQIVVRRQLGLRRARQVDTVEAALVGACDGELSVGQILDALGQLVERPGDEIRTTYLPVVRDLVAEGFLDPRWRLADGLDPDGP
jgi:methylase of polypeptide subunit release factors